MQASPQVYVTYVYDENERNKKGKKQNTCKNVIDGSKKFIGHVWKSDMIDAKNFSLIFVDTMKVLSV